MGAQLFESLIWESRGTARIFGKDGVSGLVNVDLTPDVAVRLAAALGTALKRGARVVASRESPAACRMIKRAMISGISSTGVHIADLRVSPAAVARHLVKSEAHDAGFHVGISQSDPEVIRIQFFEPPGVERLGVEVVSAHAFTGEGPDFADSAPGLAAAIGQAKRLVPVVGADLGAVFDRAAERLLLVDEQAHEVPVEQALLLFLRLLGSNGRHGKLAFPVTVTSQVEKLVEDSQLEVVRTPTSLPDLTRAAAEGG